MIVEVTMEEIKLKANKPLLEGKLTDKQKKGIDILVNGLFVVMGLYVVVYPGLTDTDFHTVVGLLAIYCGIRFMPR
ncbi:MAG: hypothetical protein MPEBLZ_04378 [Candidatus Methanoperedens nitroreducens]|uniref:Uncharacterized protein n=1 Tax=Candidatus Methanoperedens nitratireducens TaxID=1392998 RepID=A0A0P8C3E7_9EURY|nr:MAG: hypothetical protein F9K14_03250 [Candidatus Methanoperedens sp.]KPQ41064.1 MAG: hypothetical protein MPEBLZ_04378 [Candidatus Methanoperedens sp. BLZ1]MBZ0175248.1 hypothetical protein [Candidatus Methanoperedens nitroreducens]MCX9076522.1 hypothetical protein [Candidatus Methanoperedens sp.]